MGRMTGNGGTESTMGNLGRNISDASDEAKSRLADLKDAAMGYGDKVGGFVKDHPLPAILTGVGIGFLIGRLLSR